MYCKFVVPEPAVLVSRTCVSAQITSLLVLYMFLCVLSTCSTYGESAIDYQTDSSVLMIQYNIEHS